MENDAAVYVTITAMAVVTCATRVGGLWLMDRFTPSQFVSACLSHLPGTLLISIVSPLLLGGKPADWAASGVTILIMTRTGNLLFALASGVIAVAFVRSLAP